MLGVTYNLADWVLEIKEGRRQELSDEIEAILKSDSLGRFGLGPSPWESLRQWLFLVTARPPRSIDFCANKRADCVLFTDGFSPDPKEFDPRPDRI